MLAEELLRAAAEARELAAKGLLVDPVKVQSGNTSPDPDGAAAEEADADGRVPQSDADDGQRSPGFSKEVRSWLKLAAPEIHRWKQN